MAFTWASQVGAVHRPRLTDSMLRRPPTDARLLPSLSTCLPSRLGVHRPPQGDPYPGGLRSARMGTLNAPRSSSSGIAVGFRFDWPPVGKFAFDEPWVRPHLGRVAQFWGTMPQRSEGPNFWLNEVKLGVTDSVIRPWCTRAASHVIHRLFVESNPNKGTSIRGSILRRQASQHTSPNFATVRSLALELLRKRG